MSKDKQIRPAKAQDSEQLANIYNHYIRDTIVTFEEVEITSQEMQRRLKAIPTSLPWLVYESQKEVIGYAYASPWKKRRGYRFAVESSIYLHYQHLGKGIGTQLYQTLFEQLQALDIHTIIGGVALPNAGSVYLHEKLGFQKVAHFYEVGYKFDQWIDVGYWQWRRDIKR